jgi:hypothetical protein
MKTTRKKKAATPSQDIAAVHMSKPNRKYASINPQFVKALAEICERLKVAEDQLLTRWQTDGDLTAAQLWLEAQNQWRVGHGLLQRLTAPAVPDVGEEQP